MDEEGPRPETHVVDVFMMSVKCGNCDRYQTLIGFEKREDVNVYTYECDWDASPDCDPNVTRTIVEVPKHVDASTRRHEEVSYPERPGSPES
ncbi:MAG TPA: hypothetical protein VG777_03780 [Thermoanaerobaculia bacterium]|nr:hypothetical protein [Thermoanaerobaculia bacterium]